MDDQKLYTLNEVIQFLRVSRSTIFRMMERGELAGHKAGKGWRFYGKEVKASLVDHSLRHNTLIA